jgi:Cu+-exporting ATPase
MTTIGYEPYISLDSQEKKKVNNVNKSRVYKLGVAGFCFGNIMMMSFPEYLSGGHEIEQKYALLFRLLNLSLALPVFFYSASEFFATAWTGLKQRVLNIDAPIALSILITFSRSVYEIATGTGGGYLDSMSGIVFFMLVGRLVQERTYQSLSFHRDYKAYFPIAVNVLTTTGVVSKRLTELREKDIVRLYNDEIIPADSILLRGKAHIDYSFVTGESEPVTIEKGSTLYAGGKQVGEQLDIEIIKPVAGSYLTSLWNHYAFSKNKERKNDENSITHVLSKYFTLILFILAAITAVYWAIADPSKILPSVSAMLIVACPCALLLATTFTNGNLLRIFSDNGLYLRDASVIEQLGKVNHVIFDKTGTLTQAGNSLTETGDKLDDRERCMVASVAAPSKHPYSQAICMYYDISERLSLDEWNEITGKGIRARVAGIEVLIGSSSFVSTQDTGANVYVRINGKLVQYHSVPDLRPAAQSTILTLDKNYNLSLLSGDNDRQKETLGRLFGSTEMLHFNQKPVDKLNYIETLQEKGAHVAMIGDGLNDAGALQQSDVGITLADDINNFTPSCDAILDASKLEKVPALFKMAKLGRNVIYSSFTVSILYNIVGLSISVQGKMSPMIAAILMPVSTLSIVLITSGISSLLALKLGLSLKHSSGSKN